MDFEVAGGADLSKMPHQLILVFLSTSTIPKAHAKLPTTITNHQSYSSPDKLIETYPFVPRIMELITGQKEIAGFFKGGIVSKGAQALDEA
jgi:hypothetical protein